MMMKHILALALLCMSSMTMARSLTQPPLDPAKTAALELIKVVDVDPALWVVKDKDTTIYLFGTIHILKPGLSWFDEAVKAAFDRSDELVVEMVEPSAAESQEIFSKYGIDQSGRKLSAKLAEADRPAYSALLNKLKIPMESFDPLDPWAVAVTLQMVSLQASGFDPNSGVDGQLEAAAKAVRKPVRGVETFEWQLSLFDTLPEASQLQFLNESVRDFDEMSKGMEQLVTTWSKPDPDGLAQLMNDGLVDPILYKRLLSDRNSKWAKWIDERMKQPGTVFMAVGAGHLAGKDSVQNQLKAYKRKSKRVKY
jgi:uncharacterized protein